MVLIGASIFFIYDIISDIRDASDNYLHLITEGGVFIAITIILFLELKRVYHLKLEVQLEKEKVGALSGELYKIILNKLEEWDLSESEKQVAIFIIKGYSMREIAELRNVKEKTIRQQATSIYSKTGVTGRYELASYFIEDLLRTD